MPYVLLVLHPGRWVLTAIPIAPLQQLQQQQHHRATGNQLGVSSVRCSAAMDTEKVSWQLHHDDHVRSAGLFHKSEQTGAAAT